jgi:hypothetical protein
MKTIKQLFVQLALLATSLSLVACGGAGAGATGAGTGGTSGSGSTGLATLTLAAFDAAGASTHSIAAGATAKASALFKSSTGAVIPNALVTFKLSSATLAVLSPAEGTALTDATGVASIDVNALAPNPGGAFAIQATAVSGTVTATATDWTLNVGAAAVVVSGASHAPASSASAPLQAGSTVTVKANVTSSGNPVSSGVALTASSACITQGKAEFTAIGVVGGVFTGSYKNKGCLANPDTVTLSQVGGNASTTLSIYTAASSLAEIRFVAVSPSSSSLVIKGGGGLGRVESGIVTFELLDNVQQPIQGATVNFSLSSSAGGLKLDAASGVSGVDGKVSATVKSGTVPTPFVVSAATAVTVAGATSTLSANSSVLNISVGLPEQKNMSLGAVAANIEGLGYDGVTSAVTARLADFWGNKVADGTTVNMITEGGVIGSSSSGACTTVDGACSLNLSSQSFKPSDGRVSVTAYAEGPISFNDVSGVGDFTAPGTVCYHYGDPFVDMNEDGVRTATLSGLSGQYPNPSENFIPFVGNAYTPPASSVACGTVRGKTYIFKQATFTFSGSFMWGASAVSTSSKRANMLSWPLDFAQFTNRFYGDVVTVSCGIQRIPVQLFDDNFNPMPIDTTISVKGSTSLGAVALSIDKMPSTNAKGGIAASITLEGKCDPAVAPATGVVIPVGRTGEIVIEATTPKGNKSQVVIPTIY